jgi:hypothetical protein
MTEAPTSTVDPPVKLVIENAVASEIVIVFPPLGVQVSPAEQAIVSAPVNVLSEFTPPIATAACVVVKPFGLVVTWHICVASPQLPDALFTVASVAT